MTVANEFGQSVQEQKRDRVRCQPSEAQASQEEDLGARAVSRLLCTPGTESA